MKESEEKTSGAAPATGPVDPGAPPTGAPAPTDEEVRAASAAGEAPERAAPPSGDGAPAAAAPPPAAPEAPAPAEKVPPEAEASAPAVEASPGPPPPTLVVRYGRMGLLGRFTYKLERWRRGDRVVIQTDRGMEIGTVVCRWSHDGQAGEGDLKVRGKVIRLATHDDEVDARHLEKEAEREFAFCRRRIAARRLPMKLVAVEHLFGGDRIIFYFVAEKRVDFRALVRDLAREFRTRIELRQIGVRDEARLLGDYERCGRPLCCRAFIRSLEPVSMKMAKLQKATLDPSKISGRCGRLMCCLRFEDATYRDLAKNLPRKNTRVGTAMGPGKVVGSDVVTQTVQVLLDSGARITVPVETLMPPEHAPSPGTVEPVTADRADAEADGARSRARRRKPRRSAAGAAAADAPSRNGSEAAPSGVGAGGDGTGGGDRSAEGTAKARPKRRRRSRGRRGRRSGSGGGSGGGR